jgi:hypothetical protein
MQRDGVLATVLSAAEVDLAECAGHRVQHRERAIVQVPERSADRLTQVIG